MSEKTKRVILRPFTKKDIDTMVSWNNDPELEYLMDRCLPKTREKCLEWFEKYVPEKNYRLYALENEDGVLLGEVELDHICWKRREAELRIRIGEKKYWNKGYGTLALQEILQRAFYHFKLEYIYLRVYAFNSRAIHCYEKVGFRRRGFLKRSQDKEWKEILLMGIDREKFQRKVTI